jgi:hypothetical protein
VNTRRCFSKAFPDDCHIIFDYNAEQLAQWLQRPNPFLIIKRQMLDKLKKDLDDMEHVATPVVTVRSLPPSLAPSLPPLPPLPGVQTSPEMFFDADDVRDVGEI